MSSNTGLQCLGCLFSKHGSFTSQPRRTSSGVVFAVREGQSEKDGYLLPAWARSASPIQPSLAGADSQILQLCAGCQSKLLHGKSTHHWNWSHGHPEKLSMMWQISWLFWTLWIQLVLNGEGAWLILAQSSKPTTSEPLPTVTKSSSIVMLLESSVPHSLQQIPVAPRFARCWSAPFMQNRWLWQCQRKLWLLCKAVADALGGCLRQLVLMCKPAKGSRSAKMAGWPNTA